MGRLTNTDAMDALVQAAQQDNRAAFRQLYERYKQRVFRTANRLLNDQGWAEDVTQEVFMTVYQQLSTFDFRSSFKTWCYRITVNACYDAMRKQKRRARYQAEDVDLHNSDTNLKAPAFTQPDQAAHRSEVQHGVEHAMQSLSPKLRATFVLREVEGLSYDEIASVMGCLPGTVSSRITRARQQLAAVLRDAGIDETYFE